MVYSLFNQLKTEKFTGLLKVRTKTINRRNQWKVYFYFGQLTWADGGCHPQRSWQRHLKKYLTQIDLNAINIKALDSVESQEYYLLKTLLERQLVELEQLKKLIINKLEEVIFDILQQANLEALCFDVKPVAVTDLPPDNFPMSITLIEVESVWQSTQMLWLDWLQKGLNNYFPNSVPIIKNPHQLSQELPQVAYQNFVRLLNGTNTLRDIAMKMNKDLVKVTCSLALYHQKGFLDFIEVPDLALPKSQNNNYSSFQSKKLLFNNQPLIVCIDDSPQVCQIMEQIITQANYRFLGIQKSLEAIPTLINTNPSLIFLDLGMPILNGYEVCAQIKKVSKLQDIPVVMLTGSDGVLDRVKAKVVGSVDFINKPIDSEQIIKTIHKFTKEKQLQVSSVIN